MFGLVKKWGDGKWGKKKKDEIMIFSLFDWGEKEEKRKWGWWGFPRPANFVPSKLGRKWPWKIKLQKYPHYPSISNYNKGIIVYPSAFPLLLQNTKEKQKSFFSSHFSNLPIFSIPQFFHPFNQTYPK